MHSDYTFHTLCFVQFGHKISALEEKTDMKRPVAWSNTSIAEFIGVLQPAAHTGLNGHATKTAFGSWKSLKEPAPAISEAASLSGFKGSRSRSRMVWRYQNRHLAARHYTQQSQQMNSLLLTTNSQGNKAPLSNHALKHCQQRKWKKVVMFSWKQLVSKQILCM